MHIKAIIFDWGGTIADAETKQIYPEAKSVLEYCKSKRYRLALAVIASKWKERVDQVEGSGFKEFFELALIDPLDPEKINDPTYKGKDKLYDQINDYFKLPRSEVLIIDDRTVRGIRYANKHGHPNIWVQRGKFAHELPNDQTGQPTYTVQSLEEILNII